MSGSRLKVKHRVLSIAAVTVSLAAAAGSFYAYKLGLGDKYLFLGVLWIAILTWALRELTIAFKP